MGENERYVYWAVIAVLWLCNGYTFRTWHTVWIALTQGESAAIEMYKSKTVAVTIYILGPILSLLALLGLLG